MTCYFKKLSFLLLWNISLEILEYIFFVSKSPCDSLND